MSGQAVCGSCTLWYYECFAVYEHKQYRTSCPQIQRYNTTALLYSEIGFERKAAFFSRIMAMHCVAQSLPQQAWALVSYGTATGPHEVVCAAKSYNVVLVMYSFGCLIHFHLASLCHLLGENIGADTSDIKVASSEHLVVVP